MTKIDLLKKALQENDKNNAILLAFKLPVHLGQDLKKTVDLATQCIKNPSFYRSVGTDIEQSINVAFEGLKTKILV